MKKICNKNTLFLVLFIFIGIIIVNFLGTDSNWDLAAYHYYSVYALFNNRIGFDIMPCGIQSYLNPIMDIPFYFLVKYFNNFPRLLMSFQSIYWSLAVFLTYLIAQKIYKKQIGFYIFFAVVLGSTGFVSILEIGSTFNDLIITIFVLLALLIFEKFLFKEHSTQRTIYMAASGLIFGMAAGLKASALLFFIAAIFALICTYRYYKNPFKIIFLVISGGILGYLITNGYWMYILYSKFQNPFFPYYNNFFKSEYAPFISHIDMRHIPKSTLQWLFFPFYWGGYSFDNITIEFAHIDYRSIALYLTFFIIFTGNIIFTRINLQFSDALNKSINTLFVNFLIFFLFFTYIIWINTSATLRYLLPLEFLCGIYISIVLIYINILTNSIKQTRIFAILLLGIILFTTRYSPLWMTRRNYDNIFLYMPDLNLPDNAVVCILGGYPTQIFIPFQNPKAKFIYLSGEIQYSFVYNEYMAKKIKEIISDSSKTIYLLYAISPVAPVEWEIIKHYVNPEDFECSAVKNSTFYIEDHKDFQFCTSKGKNK